MGRLCQCLVMHFHAAALVCVVDCQWLGFFVSVACKQTSSSVFGSWPGTFTIAVGARALPWWEPVPLDIFLENQHLSLHSWCWYESHTAFQVLDVLPVVVPVSLRSKLHSALSLLDIL